MIDNSLNLDRLEAKLGYSFKDRSLLVLALSHRSVNSNSSNERLEFVGDRVLSLIMAHWLYDLNPQSKEGLLAKLFNGVVQKSTLHAIAIDIGLADHVILSPSAYNDGLHNSPNLLADSLEAVIAAIYIDSDLITVNMVVKSLWADFIAGKRTINDDPKSLLQIVAVAKGFGQPIYYELGRTGPEHSPSFEISVHLSNGWQARAVGGSKSIAQQIAARIMLEKLKTK